MQIRNPIPFLRRSRSASRNRFAAEARGLAGWLLLTFAAAAAGGLATANAPQFYAQLLKPDWAPPARLFGPVWSMLYFLMAVAAWQVWRVRGFASAPKTLALFMVQLAVNALWSWLFFAWRLGAWAFVDVVALWLLIAATIAAFRRVRPFAAALLLPYLAWVSFATALTWATWQRNPQLLG
jgi:translocator protein